jgi:NADH dehydrogenase [ubiquinone] 1 alpha subcomplex assembly factor 7
MLKDVLIQLIRQHGSIDFYTYMKLCQQHPDYGYYAIKSSNDILGATGDFITAPEISSLFGEMIAFWIVTQWERLGSPAQLQLLELGPGRGILMKDILTTLRKLKSFTASVLVHMAEINPSFKKAQIEALNGLCEIVHHEPLDFLHEAHLCTIIIANEFFDALPVHQYIQDSETPGKWLELYVGATDTDELQLEYAPFNGTPKHTEIQPDTDSILSTVYDHIQRNDGAALLIDYGYWNGVGDTIQALYHHQHVGILDHPGQADLTVHVNFQHMASPCESYGLQYSYQTQRKFLMDFGIQLRVQQLKDSDDAVIQNAVHRLIDPAEMGHLFKVLQVWKDYKKPGINKLQTLKGE